MKKTELTRRIAMTAGVSQSTAKDVLDAFIKEVTHGLMRNEHIAITGFGKFVPRVRSARVGTHVQTGEKINIGSKVGVGFILSVPLKEALNSPLS